MISWFFRRKRHQEQVVQWEQAPAIERVYIDEDGRRHRTDAPYLLPKDEKEGERLDYQHFIFRHILQGNTFAPVSRLLKKDANVLDVGCGTSRWGYEIAREYPRTSVVGFDLEDVSVAQSQPLKYRFVAGNVLNGLPFQDHYFQYVHQRALVAAIPVDKWPSVLKELWRVTALHGWVESVEMGAVFHNAGPATTQFLQWFAVISGGRGIDAQKVVELPNLFQQTGFSHIKAKTEQIPVGKWGGRFGNLMAQDILAGWPSMRLPASHIGVAPNQFDSVIAALEQEWDTFKTTYEVYFLYGQKV